MKARNLTKTALLALILTGCQREVSELNTTNPANPNNPSAPATGERLAATYYRDSTLPAGQDTAWISRFYYDASGRISVITSTDKLPGGDSIHYQVFYNGTDTLAAKLITYERKSGPMANIYRDTSWRQYVGDKLVYDSTSSGGSFMNIYSVRHYVYQGNRVFHYTDYGGSFIPGLPITGEVHAITYQNGTIVAQKDSNATYNVQTGVITATTAIGAFTATYDTRPNPLYIIGRSFRMPYVAVEYFVELPAEDYVAPFLPLTGYQTDPAYGTGGFVRTENVYSFGAAGLPTKMTRRTSYQNGIWEDDDPGYFLYQ